MPQCPKCGAALKDDFGMQACVCGEFVFVDMDGNVRIEEAESASEFQSSINIADFEPPKFPSDSDFGIDSESEPSANDAEIETADGFSPIEPFPIEPMKFPETSMPSVSVPNFDSGSGSESSDSSVGFPDDSREEASEDLGDVPLEASTEGEAPAQDFSMDAFLGYDPNAPEGGQADDAGAASNQGPSSYEDPRRDFDSTNTGFQGQPGDPLGLNSYANSEISQAKDGLLVFRIHIAGIDSKEMRASLREVIEDSRFAWNASELMSKISQGRLTIENLSPVKAIILVNRIKRLPLQIRWEQHAITQLDQS